MARAKGTLNPIIVGIAAAIIAVLGLIRIRPGPLSAVTTAANIITIILAVAIILVVVFLRPRSDEPPKP